MARPAKPFAYRGHWCSKIQGKITRLLPLERSITEARKVLEKLRSKPSTYDGKLVDVAAQYLATKTAAPATLAKNRQHFATLLAMFGERAVASITSLDALTWNAKIGATLKGSSFNGYLKSCRALFRFACDHGYASSNPFKKVPLKVETHRERIVTAAEFQALMRVASVEWKQLLLMFKYSAARPQDVYQAKWNWLSPCGKFITVPVSQHKTGNKTGDTRIVFLRGCLRKLIAHRRKVSTSATIFDTSLSMLDNGFRRLCCAAGIGADPGGELLVVYSLRHTRLTELGINKKTPAAVLQKIAGHKTLAMTMRYIHPDTETVLKYLD